MSWTIADVLTEARNILSDTREPYRYTDARLILALNQAFAETKRLRPDLFISVNFVLPSYTVSDTAQAFPIDEMYFPTVVDYVVGRQAFADDEFTLDGRAAAFFQKWQGNLIGGAGG